MSALALSKRPSAFYSARERSALLLMTEKAKVRRRVVISREVLLVEIERRCADPECGAKTRIGLTKEEARAYTGFECARCERTWDDALTERDIPEWWEELFVVRGRNASAALSKAEDDPKQDAAIARLSDAYRRARSPEDD